MKAISPHSHPCTPWSGRLSALLPGGLFVGFALQAQSIQAGRSLSISWEWVPGLNVRFAFLLDGLGLLFALIITAIGLLVTIYGCRHSQGKCRYRSPEQGKVFWVLVHASG